MYVFQNYRLFFGLYSKNIATFWEFEDYLQGGGKGKTIEAAMAFTMPLAASNCL